MIACKWCSSPYETWRDLGTHVNRKHKKMRFSEDFASDEDQGSGLPFVISVGTLNDLENFLYGDGKEEDSFD